MTDYDPDDNDVRDASITDTTRRGALAALGLGGLAALGSGHATADLAGGPESDAMSEHRVPYYRVPEPDLDSPGVVGRRVEITAGGSSYAAGDQLVDTGSSWERISAGVESLNTEEVTGNSGLLQSRVPLSRQTPVIEDWERQTLSYWTDTSGVTIDTSTYLQGSASVRTNADGIQGILSPFQTERGFRYRGYFRFDSHSTQQNQEFWLMISQSDNTLITSGYGYAFRVDKDDERARITRYDDGSGATLAQESGLSIKTDSWLVVEADVEFGNLSMDVKTLQSASELSAPISANDATYQQTGYLQLWLRNEDTANGNHVYTDMVTRTPL